MTTELFCEISELAELIADGWDETFIRSFLGKTIWLRALQSKTRQDWVKCIGDNKNELFLKQVELEADSCGPFCKINDLERLLHKVPSDLRNSFIYGYLSGIVDYRMATEDPDELAPTIQ